MKDTNDEPVHIPIDGILDLHLFSPKEVPSVVKEYIHACICEEIFEIRIIHGKGKGILRETVHSILNKHSAVVEFKLASDASGWGATLAILKP